MKTNNNNTNNTNERNTQSAHVTNTQRVNASAREAREQVRIVGKSLMYYINQLNKLARKNEYCEAINVREFGKEIQKIHGQKDLFHACVFTRDSQGRACVVAHSKRMPVWGFSLVNVSPEGYDYLRPISLSLVGVLNAFAKVARTKARTADAQEREQAREAKAKEKAQKAYDKARAKKLAEVMKQVTSGALTFAGAARIMDAYDEAHAA